MDKKNPSKKSRNHSQEKLSSSSLVSESSQSGLSSRSGSLESFSKRKHHNPNNNKNLSISPEKLKDTLELIIEINNLKLDIPELVQGQFISPIPTTSSNLTKKNFFQSTVEKRQSLLNELGSVKKRLIFESSANKTVYKDGIADDKENHKATSLGVKLKNEGNSNLRKDKERFEILKLRQSTRGLHLFFLV